MPNPSTAQADVPEGGEVTVNNTFNEQDFEELQEAVPVIVKETKAGYKTTEFWATVVTILAVNFGATPLPDSKEGYVSAALVAIYALARGLAKKGVPHVEEGTKV